MSRYIKIHKPLESRKAVLTGKINCLNALKRLAVFGGLTSNTNEKFTEMNAELDSIPSEIGSLLKSFPAVEVKITKSEGDVKCPYCGKFFNTKKGLAMHVKRAHPVESNEQKGSGSELDNIESQIAALEQEISSL